MNFQEYRPLALRTAKLFETRKKDMEHAALGLISEIGEFASEVKRHVVYGKPISDEMRAHMHEELGDALWYVPLALYAMGVDIDEPLPLVSIKDVEWLTEIDDLTFMLSTLGSVVAAYALDPTTSANYEVIEYLGSIVTTVDVMAMMLGTTGDQLREQNIAKLRLRFPDKYSDAAAEARADKGGLPHTES